MAKFHDLLRQLSEAHDSEISGLRAEIAQLQRRHSEGQGPSAANVILPVDPVGGRKKHEEPQPSSLNRGSTARHKSFLDGPKAALREQSWLEQLVQGPAFEIFFAVLIMLAVAIMALETQYVGKDVGAEHGLSAGPPVRAEDAWPWAQLTFDIVTWILGIFFTGELILKLLAYRLAYFKDAMNWLDFMVVSFWFASVCGLQFGAKGQFVRVLRLGRLVRLLKLCEASESLDMLFTMTTALRGSFMTLGWALVLFCMTLSFFAMTTSQILTEFYFKDTSQPHEHREELWRYFGTFTRSLFTMFELTFANWPPVSRRLVEHVSGCFMIFTVLYKLTLGFCVVGVVNGVFMQETFKVTALNDSIMVRQKKRAKEAHKKKMLRLFESADVVQDGKLSREELFDVLKDPDVREWLGAMEFPVFDTPESLDMLFEDLDKDKNGYLSLRELADGVARHKGGARSSDVLVLMNHVRELRDCLGSPMRPEVCSPRAWCPPIRSPPSLQLPGSIEAPSPAPTPPGVSIPRSENVLEDL